MLSCRLPLRFAAETCKELYFWLAPFSYHVMELNLGLGSSLTEKGARAWRRLVDITPVKKIHGVRSDVRHGNSDGSDLPLQGNVPLLEVRYCEVRVETGRVRETPDLSGRWRKRIGKGEQRHTIIDGIEIRDASAERPSFQVPRNGAINVFPNRPYPARMTVFPFEVSLYASPTRG